MGDPLTYTLTLTHTSLAAAPGATVTDTLPSGTEYLTSTGGLTSTYLAGEHLVVWELGTVYSGESLELGAVVLPVEEGLAGTLVENEAFVDLTALANLSVTVGVTSSVVAPELEIRFEDGSEPPDPLEVCEGDAVTLAGESNRAGALDYAWTLGDGDTADTRLVTHAWDAGSYTLWLTTANAYGWIETALLSVESGRAPMASFESNSPVILGQTAVFTDMTTFEPAAWLWDFGDGVGISEDPNPTYEYGSSGEFVVRLAVSNGCGVDVFEGVFVVEEAGGWVYLPLVMRSY